MEPTPALSPTLWLDDPLAAGTDVAGAKASNLARAHKAGLPVLPGFVIPVACATAYRDGSVAEAFADELNHAWSELSQHGERTLIVRSSATIEDGTQSSMAGLFTSVTGVDGWPEFLDAVGEVIASAGGQDVMAVLVQAQLDPVGGGVMFGADPVDGRTDHIIVSASAAGPQALVGGTVTGTRYVLSRRGRLLTAEHETDTAQEAETAGPDSGPLTETQLRQLAKLALRAERVFGAPQDVEFAFDGDGRLWLLQSRPVTALAPSAPRRAPLFGPGPVAETLPGVLSPLEEDLWAVPMDHGITDALSRTGAAPARRLRKRGIVVTVGGQVAADLGPLGALPVKRRWLRLVDPRPGSRRLVAAWRVGKLRSALPGIAADTVTQVDADLAMVPPVAELTSTELIAGLRWSRATLAALHSLEGLAGALIKEAEENTAAALALATLRRRRSLGWDDERILAAEPGVLALVPPVIGPAPELPPVPGGEPGQVNPILPPREQLRVRIRWTQELGARLAWAAGRQLADLGTLASPELVRWLRFSELVTALEGGTAPADLEHRAARPDPPPLPPLFRMAGQRVVAETASATGDRDGQAAGGGRGAGTVVHDVADIEPGTVLVVRTLDPGLAAYLPSLSGLVAETGSVLSHLAIMAREMGVPTVVGARGTIDRLPPETRVVVDGDAGTVEISAQHGPSGEEHAA